MDELEKYSLTITQIEQLIMAKRIYKHQDERDIRCTSPLIFFVKWLNDEICLLRASYSEYNKTWHYSVDHFNNIKGYPRAIKKDSKMLMPSPSDKELLLDLKKDKSEGYIKKKKNVRKINPLNKKK